MKLRGEIIELFGEKLLLHERTIKDSDELDEFVKSLDNWDRQTENFIGVSILQRALKLNIDRLPYFTFRNKKISLRPFRYKKLKHLLSDDHIYNNLGIGRLKELVNKIRFDLEKQIPNEDGGGEEISRANRIQLVAKYSNLRWEEVEQLSVSEFVIRLEQAINILSSELNGKFGLRSHADEVRQAQREYEDLFGERAN